MVHNNQRLDPGCRKMRVPGEAAGNKGNMDAKTKSELSSEGSGEPQGLFSRA